MQWEFLVALVVVIPIILVPVVFVWYLDIGGIYAAVQEARRKRKAIGKGGIGGQAEEHPAERELIGARR